MRDFVDGMILRIGRWGNYFGLFGGFNVIIRKGFFFYKGKREVGVLEEGSWWK